MCPITFGEVDPREKWNIKIGDLVFNDKELEWVDQVNQAVEAIAIAKEARTQGDLLEDPEDNVDKDVDVTEPEPETQAYIIAPKSSKTHLRCTHWKVVGSTSY